MKHNFPDNRHVYCNEKHTLKQAKEFVFLAKLVGLEIAQETLEELVDKRYPYFCWDYGAKIITQHAEDSGDYEDDAWIVSFEEFKKFLGSIPSTRVGVEKLFSTV